MTRKVLGLKVLLDAEHSTHGFQRIKNHLLSVKPLEKHRCFPSQRAVMVECGREDHADIVDNLLVGNVHHGDMLKPSQHSECWNQ